MATLMLPTDGGEGSISLNFSGEGQQKLNLQTAVSLLNSNVLDSIVRLPGLNVITALNLSSVKLGFDASLKIQDFTLQLNANQIDVCKQLKLSNAFVEIIWVQDEPHPFWSVEFGGTCNDKWHVSLHYSSSQGQLPATIGGRISFEGGLHIDSVLQPLFDITTAATDAKIEMPASAKDLLHSVVIDYVSLELEATAPSPRILRAEFMTNLAEPVLIAEVITLQELSLKYIYDTKSATKSTGTLTADIDIAGARLNLAVSKTPDMGWTFDGRLKPKIPFNLNDIIGKVISNAPLLGDLFSGAPDALNSLPTLKLKGVVVHAQTGPFKVNLYGSFNFGGVDCDAEVVVGKSDGSWVVGIALGSSNLSLSNVVTSTPSTLTQAMKMNGTCFSIVSRASAITNFFSNSTFGAVNSVLSSHSSLTGVVGIASISVDFASSTGVIKEIAKIVGLENSALQVYGLLSSQMLELAIALKSGSKPMGGSFATLDSIEFFLQMIWSPSPSLALGLKINKFTIHLLGETLEFSGRLATALDPTKGVELSIFASLDKWEHPFGVSFLTLQNIKLGASLNPVVAAEPISEVELGAGVQLVKGSDQARGISGEFLAYVRLYGKTGFYLSVALRNVTFANIFEFIVSQPLPSCFDGIDLGFESLDLVICTTPSQLPDGRLVNPTFKTSGELSLYFLKLFWDIDLGSFPPSISASSGMKIIAAAEPLHLLNDRIVLIADDGSQDMFKDVVFPKDWKSGGATFAFNSQKVLLEFTARLEFFALSVSTHGSIGTSAISFSFDAKIGDSNRAILACTLNSQGLAASGSLHIDVAFDTPDINLMGVTILRSKHFAFTLDSHASLWANAQSMGFKFDGKFDLSFSTLDLHVVLPTLDVNIPFRSLKDDAPALISNTIVSNLGAILLAALKNLSNLGEFLVGLVGLAAEITIEVITGLVKALGRGLEEAGRILKDFFKKTAEEIVNLLSNAYNVAARFVKRALKAIGEFFEDIGNAICDAVDAVGNFFSGLFGGYSTARILKKLSLIGNQLDDVANEQRQILAGLSGIEGGLQAAIGDLENLTTSFDKLDGQLWEIHGALEKVHEALEEIDGSLQQLHMENVAIQNALHELSGEIDWRQSVLVVSDYVNRIQSAFKQLILLQKSDSVGAWEMARAILHPAEGILCALDGIHAAIMGSDIASGKSILLQWAELSKAQIAKNDANKFGDLVDQFVMHLQTVQKNGLVLLINAFTLLGDRQMATMHSRETHTRLVKQLQLRDAILQLPTHEDCTFFTHKQKKYAVIDHRIHELSDDATASFFGFNDHQASSIADSTNLANVAPMGIPLVRSSCKAAQRPEGTFLIVNGGARLVTPRAIVALGGSLFEKEAAANALNDADFSAYVAGDPIDLDSPSSMGFSIKVPAANGTVVWEHVRIGTTTLLVSVILLTFASRASPVRAFLNLTWSN
jgi:hypothetical protein